MGFLSQYCQPIHSPRSVKYRVFFLCRAMELKTRTIYQIVFERKINDIIKIVLYNIMTMGTGNNRLSSLHLEINKMGQLESQR